jgi:diadenosine hexaphosphate hydrolase (ATP-forming)
MVAFKCREDNESKIIGCENRRSNMRKEISAGGVVFRQHQGNYEVLLIDDRFGKLTLPKGHQEAGESLEQTAIREIAEETGVHGEIMNKITTITYTFTHEKYGEVEKEVMYYLVRAHTEQLEAQLAEISGVCWYSLDEAQRLHKERGYENNQAVLEAAIKEILINK